MILYHGTSERNLSRILSRGIEPRSLHDRSNWKHTSESNPEAVYLTNAYALYFADAASDDGERLAVLEIDSSLLDQELLCADEDFIAQARRHPKMSLIESASYYRETVKDYPYEQSLDQLGNCAYLGMIPTTAITRIALVEGSTYYKMILMGHDPTITVMNYRLVGHRYRATLRWLFDPHLVQQHVDSFNEDPFSIFDRLPIPDDREGIKIIIPT